MKQTIKQMKALSPAYKDMDDGEFAFKVWNAQKERAANLSDVKPMGIFADEVELDNAGFKGMLKFSESAGYDPTDRTISSEHIPEGSEGRALFQGQTFGFGDEIIGGMAAGIDKISGNEKPLGELYTQYRDKERQQMKEYRQNAPKKALAYELGGAILSPAALAKIPQAVKGLSAGKQAMAISGAYGTVYGAGSSEAETAGGVAKDAAVSGFTSALFGLGVQKAIPFVGKKAKGVHDWMKKAQDKPTMETLKIAKNKAYALVESSAARFGARDFDTLWRGANKIAAEHHHEAYKEKAVQGALNMFKGLKSNNSSYTLSQLDKIRQQLGVKYKAKPEQRALGDMMDLVDDVIMSKSGEFPQMAAARLANTRYKKAEKLDKAFHDMSIMKADKSEMSEPDLYKGAIKNLLRNKKDIKWFSEEEKVILEKFIEGNVLERALHRTATFSPTSNKLLTMLAFAGSYLQPLILVPVGLGMVAKRITDKTIRTKAQELIKKMGGIETPAVKLVPGAAQVGTTSAVNQNQQNN